MPAARRTSGRRSGRWRACRSCSRAGRRGWPCAEALSLFVNAIDVADLGLHARGRVGEVLDRDRARSRRPSRSYRSLRRSGALDRAARCGARCRVRRSSRRSNRPRAQGRWPPAGRARSVGGSWHPPGPSMVVRRHGTPVAVARGFVSLARGRDHSTPRRCVACSATRPRSTPSRAVTCATSATGLLLHRPGRARAVLEPARVGRLAGGRRRASTVGWPRSASCSRRRTAAPHLGIAAVRPAARPRRPPAGERVRGHGPAAT